jgi:hypothetical protein
MHGIDGGRLDKLRRSLPPTLPNFMHIPYYQLSYTLDMKSRTEYIRRECVSDIRRQIRNYKRFKKLSGEWIALGIPGWR